MEEDFSQNNKYTTRIKKHPESLGVAEELRRFAMNEYLDTKNKNVLVGTSDTVVDDDLPVDDLLLSNAVTENTVQDDLDKTRYLKETKSYVTINSSSRNTTAQTSPISDSTLFSTGITYYPIYPFAPYLLITDVNGDPIVKDGNYYVNITANSNHIQFQLQDITIPSEPIQVLTPELTDTFDVFLPPNGNMTLDELQTALTTNINLVASTGEPLINSPDKYHMFTIEVSYNEVINPDRTTIKVYCQDNFQFTMTFYSYGNIESAPIMEPLSASDSAYVVQDPANVYPYPCSYAIDLNKAYTTVKAIRVISSEIPNTDTIINSYNNRVTFWLINKTLPFPTEEDPVSQNIKTSDGSIAWTVYIPYGNYNLTQLVYQLELLVNNMLFGEANISDIFTVTGNETTNIFEISVSDPYAFKWDFNAVSSIGWRNLYDMLGFKVSVTRLYVTEFTNLISSKVGTITIKNPYKPIVLRKSNVVWLQMNNYETIYDSLTQIHYFCRFNLNNVNNGENAYDTFTQSAHVFVDSPIPVLQTVDVRMYDELGLPYNFNGRDHSFTLEITHHIDRLMGVDFSSRRGVNDKSSYI